MSQNHLIFNDRFFNNLKVSNTFKLPIVNTLINPNPSSPLLMCYDVATNSILYSTKDFQWKVVQKMPLTIV